MLLLAVAGLLGCALPAQAALLGIRDASTASNRFTVNGLLGQIVDGGGDKRTDESRIPASPGTAAGDGADDGQGRLSRTRRGWTMRSVRSGFTLVELLVVIAIIGILIALLLPAVQAAREAARRMQCSNNLKQIALALHNYHDTHNCFPPVGTTIWDTGTMEISWLYLILPYVEQTPVYDEMKEAPNAYHATLSKQVAPVFLCPSDGKNEFDYINLAEKWRTASYCAVMGPGLDDRNVGSDSLPYGYAATDGIIYWHSGTKFGDIQDGTSGTLVAGERISDLRLWSKGWMDYANPAVFQGKNVVWPMNTDPSVLCYRHDTKPGGCPDESQSMGFNNIDFGSRHPGGAQFAFADGSVHFLSETINFETYQQLATRDGGEVAEWSP